MEEVEDGSEVSEDEDLTLATPPPRRSKRSPSLSSSRQTTRKDDVEEEVSDEDNNDEDDDDEIMLAAKDAEKEEVQMIALNESGMYPLGTVITKQFEEGWFTGKIVSYVLINDDTYPHYFVVYEDGDKEDLSLSEIEELLKAASEKRNETKEPAKKKRKTTAKAPLKKAAKANSAQKPSAVQKRRLTQPRKTRDTKKNVADLEDSDTEVDSDSDTNKKLAAVPNRRSLPRQAQNAKRCAARLEESYSDAETESDVSDMDGDSDGGSVPAVTEIDDNLAEKVESEGDEVLLEAPPPKKKQRAAAKAKATPSKKKGTGTSTSDKRAAATEPKAAQSKKKGAATSTSEKRASTKPATNPKAAQSKKKDAVTSTTEKRNVLKVPYSRGDGLEIISEPQAMFDDLIDTKLTVNGENSEVLVPLVKALKNRTLRVATMCSGTESPILALDMLQKSIRKHCSTHLSWEMDELGINVESLFQIEHVFSCEIEPFKQAYIERNFHPPLLFRDIRELGDDKAHTAYGSLVDVPNTPGCVDMLIAGTSCVDYSNLNNRKVSELDSIKQLCPIRAILTRPLLVQIPTESD